MLLALASGGLCSITETAKTSDSEINRITLALCQALEETHHRCYINSSKHNVYLRTEYLKRIVAACWYASELNPAWDDAEKFTLRFLSVIFVESGFNHDAYNKNKNGTVDEGLCQVNSVHLEKTYRKFLDQEGFMYQEPWDIEINIRFAAYLNEMFYQHHQRLYQFEKKSRPDQRKFFRKLKWYAKRIKQE